MESIDIGQLRIDVAGPTGSAAALRLDWRGRSTERQPHLRLEPFFGQVMKEAEHRASPIELHLEELSGLNSSTIGFLIQLIPLAQRRGVKLVIVYDASQLWQRASFKVFEIFAADNPLFELRTVSV